jgi:UDP-N-acetylglucosamine 1-carboxyvinyltransferase
MLAIMEKAGAEIEWIGERSITVRPKNFDPRNIDGELVKKLRGSVLFLAPSCLKADLFSFPYPGGCLIGARPIDSHLDVLRQYGFDITQDSDALHIHAPEQLKPSFITMPELSVTATCNALMLAARIEGKTTIHIADSDYQVQELAYFLQKMGATIEGIASHTLVVKGSSELHGASHDIIPDPIEAGTFILLAHATKSNLTIKNVEAGYLTLFFKRLKDFGFPYEFSGPNTLVTYPWNSAKIDRIQTLPHPGLATDLQSAFGVLATQTKGATLLHDPLYEGRLKYLEELNQMGADIIFCDPHRAIINGPTPLYGTSITSVDLRGGAALVIAGLVAHGKTAIGNVYQIDRGYEKLEERLQSIGADIQRIKT